MGLLPVQKNMIWSRREFVRTGLAGAGLVATMRVPGARSWHTVTEPAAAVVLCTLADYQAFTLRAFCQACAAIPAGGAS